MNQLIAKEIIAYSAQNVQVIWQCGKLYFEEYKHFGDNENIKVMSFIDRMDLVYAAADVVISVQELHRFLNYVLLGNR